MADERVLVFVKLPLPGVAKTRLAAEVGDERAVALYDAMVRDVMDSLDAAGAPVTVCHAPVAPLDAYRDWLGRGRRFMLQEGEDLGERMARAFEAVFASGAERAVLVGGDLPGLAPGAVRAALDAVADTGAALAPGGDGGYSLIGFRRDAFAPEVFSSIPWSTPDVLPRTLAAFERLAHPVHLLSPIPDVDTAADLATLAATPEAAPHARRTLALFAATR